MNIFASCITGKNLISLTHTGGSHFSFSILLRVTFLSVPQLIQLSTLFMPLKQYDGDSHLPLFNF